MADRFVLKQFAGSATNNGAFGAAQATGAGVQPVANIKDVQSLNAFEQGWNSATLTADKLPALEEMQGLEALLCKAIKENYSEGIPFWISGETYYQYSFVNYNGIIYYNTTGNYTANNPAIDTENWAEYKPSSAETADVADKLGTATVGSLTRGIYLDNGVPTPMSTNFANDDLSNLSAAGNDKFVTKNTEQTITKHKTFTSAPSIKNTNLPSNSTIPDSGENNVWLYANANDDSYIGGIGFSVTTTASRTLLFTRKNINGTNYNCYSGNIIENDGTIYFNVPTPPATHNMNSAATTKWVNDHRCTTAATTASSASIYKPAIVIENYRNGNQWYRKWSDGWIEQGGYKSQATPNTITLNKAFTTTDYTILALCDRMDASAAPAVAAYRNNSNYPKSTTAFTLTGNTASLGQYWYACGY